MCAEYFHQFLTHSLEKRNILQMAIVLITQRSCNLIPEDRRLNFWRRLRGISSNIPTQTSKFYKYEEKRKTGYVFSNTRRHNTTQHDQTRVERVAERSHPRHDCTLDNSSNGVVLIAAATHAI